MSEAQKAVQEKVRAIFTELAGERTARLTEPAAGHNRQTLAKVLSADYPQQVACAIAFHLVDWAEDAAFLLAVQLFPERFTKDEIAHGIMMFLIHAPNHVAAAAKLAGHPLQDVFNVGIFDTTDPSLSD